MKEQQMTQNEFDSKIQNKYKVDELALINPNIYLNPEHVKYYEMYHDGLYTECYEYLSEHRHLLKMKHTPEQFKEHAKKAIKSSRKMGMSNAVQIRSKANTFYGAAKKGNANHK